MANLSRGIALYTKKTLIKLESSNLHEREREISLLLFALIRRGRDKLISWMKISKRKKGQTRNVEGRGAEGEKKERRADTLDAIRRDGRHAECSNILGNVKHEG